MISLCRNNAIRVCSSKHPVRMQNVYCRISVTFHFILCNIIVAVFVCSGNSLSYQNGSTTSWQSWPPCLPSASSPTFSVSIACDLDSPSCHGYNLMNKVWQFESTQIVILKVGSVPKTTSGSKRASLVECFRRSTWMKAVIFDSEGSFCLQHATCKTLTYSQPLSNWRPPVWI